LIDLINLRLSHADKAFTEREAQLIVAQLAQGCKALFDKEVVHRDLNIKNVLIHYPTMELQGEDL
jgi:serine/threonine protein kinase